MYMLMARVEPDPAEQAGHGGSEDSTALQVRPQGGSVLTPQGLGNAAAAVQADNKAAKGASGTSSASKLEVPSARAAASAPPWQIRTRSMSSKAAVSPRAAAAAAAAVKQQGNHHSGRRKGGTASSSNPESSPVTAPHLAIMERVQQLTQPSQQQARASHAQAAAAAPSHGRSSTSAAPPEVPGSTALVPESAAPGAAAARPRYRTRSVSSKAAALPGAAVVEGTAKQQGTSTSKSGTASSIKQQGVPAAAALAAAAAAAAGGGDTQGRDWCALPPGILVHIFSFASTCCVPGVCVAARVCRPWRSAVDGCRDIRLLYQAGHAPADQSLAAWLRRYPLALRALHISNILDTDASVVLSALAEAAAAAVAAGQPLPLRHLHVHGRVGLPLAGRLVSELTNLLSLQLELSVPDDVEGAREAAALVQKHLAPLQQATQLEALYVTRPDFSHKYSHSWCCHHLVAELLPVSLKRLQWNLSYWDGAWAVVKPCNLAHLKQLTFLQSRGWIHAASSRTLPPQLQELVVFELPRWRAALEQQQVLEDLTTLLPRDQGFVLGSTGYNTQPWFAWLSPTMGEAAASAAIAHMPLEVQHGDAGSGRREQAQVPVLAAADALPSLRQLKVCLRGPATMAGLAAFTAVTRLTLDGNKLDWDDPQIRGMRRAWVEEAGRMPALRWLSVSSDMLQGVLGSLGGLQQVRVLVVKGRREECVPLSSSWQALPPQLQVLCWTGVSARDAAGWELRPRLRQLLRRHNRSECELVVGVDLDEVAEWSLQLAGLPDVLLQTLA